MGTGFFSKGSEGSLSGSNPQSGGGLNDAIMNDPIHQFIFGKAYAGPVAQPGPYAGVAPTLAGADAGYQLNKSGGVPLGGQAASSPQLAATFGSGYPGASPPASGASPAVRPIMGNPGTAARAF